MIDRKSAGSGPQADIESNVSHNRKGRPFGTGKRKLK